MDPLLMPRAAHELRGRHTDCTDPHQAKNGPSGEARMDRANASDRHFLPNTEFYIQIPRGEGNRGGLESFF